MKFAAPHLLCLILLAAATYPRQGAQSAPAAPDFARLQQSDRTVATAQKPDARTLSQNGSLQKPAASSLTYPAGEPGQPGETTSATARPEEIPASTSREELLQKNPISITISQSALSSDTQSLTGPIGLEQAVQIALKANYRLRQEEKSSLISKYRARQALSKFGPSASFSTFFALSSIDQMLFFQRESIASAPMQPITSGTSGSFMFAATQPLFTGGYLLGSYKAARAQERQSLAAYRAQRLSTALKVKESYWQVAWSEAQLKVASDYIKLKEAAVANMRQRVDSGKAPLADYLREEAELARARRELNDLWRTFNLSLLTLKATLSINLSSHIAIADELSLPEGSRDLNFFLGQAAINRPEIDQANSKISEARARKLVAASKFAPQVNLYGLSSNISGSTPGVNGVVEGRWGASLGIMGGITLFDSGSRLNELKASSVAIDQANIARKETELSVAQDVTGAWIDLDLARRNADLSLQELVSAEEDARLIHMRYLVGKAIALEDFAAGVKLLQARLSVLEATYKCRLAQAKLTYASGNI